MKKSSSSTPLSPHRLALSKVNVVSGHTWRVLKVLLRRSLLTTVLLFSTNLLSPLVPIGKSKVDKFHGSVVNAGPKAITVKSQDSIYRVRTFNYAPQLEKKLQAKRPPAGKKVTIRYLRGTETAVGID